MTKMMQWVTTTILFCGTTVFTSCSKNDNPASTGENLAEKIIGKWLIEDVEGQSLMTNEKCMLTFLSDSKAYMSASIYPDESESAWDQGKDYDVSINGKKVTLINTLDEHRKIILELIITSINNKEMQTNWSIIRMIDDDVDGAGMGTMGFTKVTRDYSEAILGTWEGHETSSKGSEYDKKESRWTFKNDGTYVYYSLNDADEWVPSEDDFAEYFVDGNLLCSRWKNSGEGQQEKREWWEIKSIKNGVMKWTALRQKEDRTTYTVTFEMTKVDDNSK